MNRFALRFSTALILTSSFTVVSAFFVLGQNLQRVLTLWGESLQMTVYLAESSDEKTIDQLRRHLLSDDKVDRLEFISSEKALSQFQEQMASYAPDILGDPELLKVIPSSFQFSLSSRVVPEEQLSAMREIASTLKLRPGVDEVSYGQEWVKSYSHLMAAINWSGFIFALVIIGGAVFVVSNSIRSSVHHRREEIEVLELVGATSSYIRRPFLKESLLLCAISSAAGIFLTWGLFEAALTAMKSELSLLQISQHLGFLNWQTGAGIVGGSLVLGWFATEICLRSLNDGWAASQKRKSEA